MDRRKHRYARKNERTDSSASGAGGFRCEYVYNVEGGI